MNSKLYSIQSPMDEALGLKYSVVAGIVSVLIIAALLYWIGSYWEAEQAGSYARALLPPVLFMLTCFLAILSFVTVFLSWKFIFAKANENAEMTDSEALNIFRIIEESGHGSVLDDHIRKHRRLEWSNFSALKMAVNDAEEKENRQSLSEELERTGR